MDKLTELSGEELQARAQELAAEIPAEEREALTPEDVEARANELEAVKAEIEARRAAAAEEARKAEEVARMKGEEIIKDTEDRKMMEINSREYRDLWLRNLQGNLTEEETRAYASGSTNAVPTLVSDKFFEKMKKLAPMLSEITLLRVAGNLKFVAD